MVAGAVAGWAVLSPLAHERGWAPGEVVDWESGSRGWIIWISLAALLADALVKLAWFFLRSFYGDIFRLRFLASWWRRQRRSKPVSVGVQEGHVIMITSIQQSPLPQQKSLQRPTATAALTRASKILISVTLIPERGPHLP